jgi:hypothetical protein
MLDDPCDQPVPSEIAAQPVDACGCVPPPARPTTPVVETERREAARPDSTQTVTEPAGSAPPTAVEAPGRALKIILALRPAAGSETPAYRALLAVGAEGCDPLFRSVEVEGLPAALGEVPGLVADAEDRWRSRPRYPATARREAKAAAPRSRPGPAERPAPPAAATDQHGATEPESADAAAAPRPAPSPARKPAPADQLSLFG